MPIANSVTGGERPKVVAAFVVALGLFGGFLVSDELFLVYDRLPHVTPTHWLVLCALLLSLLVIGRERGS